MPREAPEKTEAGAPSSSGFLGGASSADMWVSLPASAKVEHVALSQPVCVMRYSALRE